MTSIIKANENDAPVLSPIAKLSYIESHGHCAEPEDVDIYMAATYSQVVLKKELADAKNSYHIIYYNNRAAGYSKIILNCPYPGSEAGNIAKLGRLYLLKEFYNLHLGSELFQFNINLMKGNNQAGAWLYVWKENQRAINFYKKNGFVVTGSYDFKISETHSNPNHLMFLGFH